MPEVALGSRNFNLYFRSAIENVATSIHIGNPFIFLFLILSTYIFSFLPFSHLHRLACSTSPYFRTSGEKIQHNVTNVSFGIQNPSFCNAQLCESRKAKFSELYLLQPANDKNASQAHSWHLIFSFLHTMFLRFRLHVTDRPLLKYHLLICYLRTLKPTHCS